MGTVEYGAYDGRLRMDQARALAEKHADEAVHSWIDGEHFVVAADERKLVIDLRKKHYDILVDSETVGKFSSWQPAARKFEQVLGQAGS